MKNILIFLLGVFVLSCTKQKTELLFNGLPEERIAERNAELRSKLLESTTGWKGYLTTTAKGAYGFFIDFKTDETLNMVADLNTKTATDIETSTYRIKFVMNTSLIFDTYNYITLLQDPVPGVYGGTAGAGLKSDIEFEYLRSTSDSVILRGKKYQNQLVLTKATTGEKELYTSKGYNNAIVKTETFVANSNYMFYNHVKGAFSTKVHVALDKSNKFISLTGVTEDGSVKTSTAKYFYTLDGLQVVGDLIFDGIPIIRIIWKGTELYAIDKNGGQYLIGNSVAPIVPLHQLLGVQYKSLQVKFKTIYPGTSAKGAVIVGHYVNNLDNGYTGYTFGNGTLTLSWDLTNKRLNVLGWSNQNGNAGWTTTAVYDYVKSTDATYTFTLRSAPSGGYVAKLINETGKETINKFLLNNQIKFDYYVDGSTVYGKVFSVNEPDIVMTFALII